MHPKTHKGPQISQFDESGGISKDNAYFAYLAEIGLRFMGAKMPNSGF
jgi:hypothetical protein